MQEGRIKCPLIALGWLKKRKPPSTHHQKPHRPGNVLVCTPCLAADSGDVGLIYKPIRGSHTGKIDHISIVSLITGHHIVQQLIQLLFADARSLVDGFFDVLQIDAVCAESADVLHRNLVELVAYFQS